MNLTTWRNGAISLVGAATVVLFYLWPYLESGHPTYWLLLVLKLLLLAAPGIAVGFYVTRRNVLFGALTYAVGELTVIYESNWFGYRPVGKIFPEWPYPLYALRAILILAIIGGALGWLGARLRRRLTIGSSDRWAASSVSQGQGR